MSDMQNAVPTQAPVKVKHPAASWYGDILKNWSTRESGPKVTSELLATAHLLDRKGKRPGVEALHIAMCLRSGGCTVRQFQIAGSCGPANNYRRALVAAGVVKATVEGKPYAYLLTVTPKGEKAVADGLAKLAADTANEKAKPKASKPKGKAKAKPGTLPAPAETPISDLPTVIEGQAPVEVLATA